jgi:DNA-binding NarL/FixJ family response regulator
MDPAVAKKLFNHIAGTAASINTSLANTLSARDREVLRLLADELSNADIAKELFLSEGAVRHYVSSLFIKLGVTAHRRQSYR